MKQKNNRELICRALQEKGSFFLHKELENGDMITFDNNHFAVELKYSESDLYVLLTSFLDVKLSKEQTSSGWIIEKMGEFVFFPDENGDFWAGLEKSYCFSYNIDGLTVKVLELIALYEEYRREHEKLLRLLVDC